MPNNLEIEIFIFLVRYIIVVLLELSALICDKLFPHCMCLTLITIYCLVCCRSTQGPGPSPRSGQEAAQPRFAQQPAPQSRHRRATSRRIRRPRPYRRIHRRATRHVVRMSAIIIPTIITAEQLAAASSSAKLKKSIPRWSRFQAKITSLISISRTLYLAQERSYRHLKICFLKQEQTNIS